MGKIAPVSREQRFRARIAGPLRCPLCDWNLVFSYDLAIVHCENGVEPKCPLHGVRFKTPTVELERA